MNEFKHLKIGCTPIIYKGNKVYAVRSKEGCKGCIFEDGNGARYCYMKACCMAHLRPDKTPVIFITK